MKGRERRRLDGQVTGEAGKAMQDMSARRPVSGVFNSMQSRGGGVYAGAFRMARAGRTGALSAVTLALAMLGATPMARPQTPALPVVTITADTTEVREGERAQFTIRRTGATTAILRGSLYVTGANPALDYHDGHAFAFRRGEASKGFGVTVLDDGTAATGREVTVLVDHRYDTYTAGTPSTATMTVIDTTVPVTTVVAPAPAGSGEAVRTLIRSGQFARHMEALGDRAYSTAKARTVFTGQVVDAQGITANVEVVHQLSGEVRAQRSGQTTRAFDGTRMSGAGSSTDDLLLESFVMDTTEGMLVSVVSGGALELVGLGFGPDPRVNPNYIGVRYDIYEVAAPRRSRSDEPVETRRYYFDSATGWLVKTRSRQASMGRATVVETQFSNWQIINGSAYAGRVERREDGRLVLTFTVIQLSTGPAERPENFR